ncbi:hypothetical protein [Aphanothece minutissima]|uniref:Glycosyltransferase family 2 protein n=1 Tax=Aphanothece cf. minutissima CCALA 015 TaxID=2107695 RepID=A0ABX5F5B0_9CHRO|nr:hypothetical protein [Aphanothece minutissima]PSB36512.1 hypothetical protein C7B81_13120 [Aphanothece cf. minutissima CCALA 015]
MASISVVIQFFEDFDFIERVVERLAWVDEIVVNDGPFQFTRALLEPLVGRDLAQPSPRAAGLFALLGRRLGVPIHYHHGVFAGEREKRIHGYGLASGDVVLSVDADELLLLERQAVEHFWASGAVVASFDCVNFTYLNLVGGKAGSPLVARKPFAFKREAITAEHHLDYLWLVGVEQQAVASEDFLPEALCGGAHLTTVRSAYGASIKFGFYNCLYFHLHGERGLEGSFQAARQFFARGNFDAAAQAEVYGRAMADAIGFPNEQLFRRAAAPEVPEAILQVAEEAAAAYNHGLPRQRLNGRLVPGVPLYALMAPGHGWRVSLAIAGEARLRVLPLTVNGPPLDLGRPALEQRWAAEPLKPQEVPPGAEEADSGGERIGDLVELLVWSGEDTVAAWAEASLVPSFSLRVLDPGGAGP